MVALEANARVDLLVQMQYRYLINKWNGSYCPFPSANIYRIQYLMPSLSCRGGSQNIAPSFVIPERAHRHRAPCQYQPQFSLCRAMAQNTQVLLLAWQTVHPASKEHLHRKFHNPRIASAVYLTKSAAT
jgi:hypothetical protein